MEGFPLRGCVSSSSSRERFLGGILSLFLLELGVVENEERREKGEEGERKISKKRENGVADHPKIAENSTKK